MRASFIPKSGGRLRGEIHGGNYCVGAAPREPGQILGIANGTPYIVQTRRVRRHNSKEVGFTRVLILGFDDQISRY